MMARSRRPWAVVMSGAFGSACACLRDSQFPARTPMDSRSSRSLYRRPVPGGWECAPARRRPPATPRNAVGDRRRYASRPLHRQLRRNRVPRACTTAVGPRSRAQMSRYAPDACKFTEVRQLAASTRLVDVRRSRRASSRVLGDDGLAPVAGRFPGTNCRGVSREERERVINPQHCPSGTLSRT
jgi:hypothetical protein